MSGRDRRRAERERRIAERRPCSFAVRLRESDGKYRLNWLLDISRTGAGALVYETVRKNAVEGEIVASDIEQIFPFQAQIVWIQDQIPSRAGFHFHNPSPELQEWLNNYVVSSTPQ